MNGSQYPGIEGGVALPCWCFDEGTPNNRATVATDAAKVTNAAISGFWDRNSRSRRVVPLLDRWSTAMAA